MTHRPDTTVELVSWLIREQLPAWGDLGIRPVEHQGWDHTTFRLGDEMCVRLPSTHTVVPQILNEHHWLPLLAPHLPLAIPTVVATGAPSRRFPRPWSVHSWIEGEPSGTAAGDGLDQLADDIAQFLVALHRVSTEGGPRPGAHNYERGGLLEVVDDAVRATIDQLGDRIDGVGALDVWHAALGSQRDGADVWVHGDLTGSNVLVRGDRACGVIDFGCSAVGDPACDLTMAWTTFDGSSRQRFMRAAPIDDGGWARARGWALWKAVKALPTLPDDHPRNDGTRLGWRWTARGVVDQVITDHRHHHEDSR